MSEHPARWRLLLLYALINALMQFEWLRFAPVTDQLAAQTGASLSAVGGLSLVFPLLFLPLALPGGLLVDRWSLRRTLRVSAALMLLAALLRVLAGPWIGPLPALLLGQLLMAAMQPMVMAAIAPLSRRWFAPSQQLLATAIGTLALFVGLGLAFVLVPLTAADVLASLWWDVLALALIGVLAWVGVPRDPSTSAAAVSGAATPLLRGLRELASEPSLRRLCVLIFIGNGVFNALFTWIEPMLAVQGIDADAAGIVALSILLGGVAGMSLMPTLPSLHRQLRRTLSLAAALAIPLLLALTHLHSLPLLCGLGVLLGLSMLAPLPLLLDRVSEIAGAARAGLAISGFWLAGNAGAAAVIAALGVIADRHWWNLAGLAMAALLGLQLLTVQGLRLRRA